jgi:hypothetical protein
MTVHPHRSNMEDEMSRSLRAALALGVLAALVISSTVLGEPGGVKVLDANLVGIPDSAKGQAIQGVQGGGVAWRLDRGSVQMFADGRLQVAVRGLVFAAGPNEGKNTVPTARAIVTCSGAPAAMSGIVPFSPEGDAGINETIDLPGSCLAPAVFFAGITQNGPRWFAATGR